VSFSRWTISVRPSSVFRTLTGGTQYAIVITQIRYCTTWWVLSVQPGDALRWQTLYCRLQLVPGTHYCRCCNQRDCSGCCSRTRAGTQCIWQLSFMVIFEELAAPNTLYGRWPRRAKCARNAVWLWFIHRVVLVKHATKSFRSPLSLCTRIFPRRAGDKGTRNLENGDSCLLNSSSSVGDSMEGSIS
jgi:hypothetical protein